MKPPPTSSTGCNMCFEVARNRVELRELNELNFTRFDVRIGRLEQVMDARFAAAPAAVESTLSLGPANAPELLPCAGIPQGFNWVAFPWSAPRAYFEHGATGI